MPRGQGGIMTSYVLSAQLSKTPKYSFYNRDKWQITTFEKLEHLMDFFDIF